VEGDLSRLMIDRLTYSYTLPTYLFVQYRNALQTHLASIRGR